MIISLSVVELPSTCIVNPLASELLTWNNPVVIAEVSSGVKQILGVALNKCLNVTACEPSPAEFKLTVCLPV